MSAFVTYTLKAADRNGEVVGQLDVRNVCMPERDLALELVRERFGDIVAQVTCQRSIPARIGRVTPASQRARTTISARAKVLG